MPHRQIVILPLRSGFSLFMSWKARAHVVIAADFCTLANASMNKMWGHGLTDVRDAHLEFPKHWILVNAVKPSSFLFSCTMTSLNLFLLFHLGFDAFAFDSGRQLREVVQVQRHAALVVREPAVDGMSEFRFFFKRHSSFQNLDVSLPSVLFLRVSLDYPVSVSVHLTLQLCFPWNACLSARSSPQAVPFFEIQVLHPLSCTTHMIRRSCNTKLQHYPIPLSSNWLRLPSCWRPRTAVAAGTCRWHVRTSLQTLTLAKPSRVSRDIFSNETSGLKKLESLASDQTLNPEWYRWVSGNVSSWSIFLSRAGTPPVLQVLVFATCFRMICRLMKCHHQRWSRRCSCRCVGSRVAHSKLQTFVFLWYHKIAVFFGLAHLRIALVGVCGLSLVSGRTYFRKAVWATPCLSDACV